MELTANWVELGENLASMIPVAQLFQLMMGSFSKPETLLFFLYDEGGTRQ